MTTAIPDQVIPKHMRFVLIGRITARRVGQFRQHSLTGIFGTGFPGSGGVRDSFGKIVARIIQQRKLQIERLVCRLPVIVPPKVNTCRSLKREGFVLPIILHTVSSLTGNPHGTQQQYRVTDSVSILQITFSQSDELRMFIRPFSNDDRIEFFREYPMLFRPISTQHAGRRRRTGLSQGRRYRSTSTARLAPYNGIQQVLLHLYNL